MKMLAVLLLALICAAAFAETEYSYVSIGDYGLPVKLLALSVGYMDELPSEGDEPLFGSDLQAHLLEFQQENSLAQSGCFDFETIRLALASSSSMDEEIVWIPMHGGHKYHNDPDCSNMFDPRQMPIRCAFVLEFDFCKRCYKTDPLAAG